MKLTVGIVGVMMLFACNQEKDLPQSLCDCFDVQMTMMEEIEAQEGEMNDEMFEKIELKYKPEFDACDQLAKAFEEETKDLSEAEQVDAQQELMDDCEAYQEYVKQNEAMIKQEMQGNENPFEGMSEEEIQEMLQGAADAELELLEEE